MVLLEKIENSTCSLFNQMIQLLLEYIVPHTGMEDGSHWLFLYFVVNVCIMVILTCNLFSFIEVFYLTSTTFYRWWLP